MGARPHKVPGSLLALFILWSPIVGWAEDESETRLVSITVRNDSNAAMLNLRVGEATLLRLEPSATATVDAAPKSVLQGCFDLSQWSAALNDLGPSWADFHLRTAGFYLDAIDQGEAGRPDTAANIVALKSVPDDVWGPWTTRSGDALRLVAYASRHMVPDVVLALAGRVLPTTLIGPSEGSYQKLGEVTDLIRVAIELHGDAIAADLLRHPAWAEDRGLGDPALALAFEEHREQVLAALQGRQDAAAQEARALSSDGRVVQEVSGRLSRAFETGDEQGAAALAVKTTLGWQFSGAKGGPAETRLVCAGLDTGARLALKEKRLIAAQAYLRLGGRACGDERPHRARLAEYLSALGDRAMERLDLVNAIGWRRAAFWISAGKAHRARLADALAELALNEFERGQVKEGILALDEARDFDPLRPRVLAIAEIEPRVDQRARFGLILIMVVLGFFAFRRVRLALGWSKPTRKLSRK